MRISDWSSDVCSSDLIYFGNAGACDSIAKTNDPTRRIRAGQISSASSGGKSRSRCHDPVTHDRRGAGLCLLASRSQSAKHGIENGGQRSEEHTSELQSLMRSSYAVFCLKKNKQKHKYNII